MEQGMKGSIGLEGVVNARELGGLMTTDGRMVKHGKLLRTGKLHSATEEDLRHITEDLDTRLIVDMRTTEEIAEFPDPPIPDARNVQVKILNEDGNDEDANTALAFTKAITKESLMALSQDESVACDLYAGMVDSEFTMNAYSTFLKMVAASSGDTVLFHCTSGKDRTGTAAVLLLSALGVDRETCITDFVLSNEYLSPKIEGTVAAISQHTSDERVLKLVRSLVGVNGYFMERLFDAAEARYGSMMGFITEGLGITQGEIDSLRANYTE